MSQYISKCPCGQCGTCACSEIPQMDEDGLCASCGGVPYVVALLQGPPHVGTESEGDERRAIGLMIDDPRAMMRGQKWLAEYDANQARLATA